MCNGCGGAPVSALTITVAASSCVMSDVHKMLMPPLHTMHGTKAVSANARARPRINVPCMQLPRHERRNARSAYGHPMGRTSMRCGRAGAFVSDELQEMVQGLRPAAYAPAQAPPACVATEFRSRKQVRDSADKLGTSW